MNRRTKNILNEYSPILSIVVYRSEQSGYDTQQYYLESHDVDSNGQVLAGKPLLQETIQEIVDVMFDERQNQQRIKGLFPENLLSFQLLPGGNYRMSWYRPSEQRVLLHSDALKIKTDKAWVPAVLYIADRKSLFVFALNKNTRPGPDSKIFLPPFFNVSNDGNVCLGNARIRKPSNPNYEDLMKYWEDIFWLSEFTHVNGDNKVKGGNLVKFWRERVGKGTKFDNTQLLPAGKKTLKNLI